MHRSGAPSDAVPSGWTCGASALPRSRWSIRRWNRDQSSSSPTRKDEYLTSPTRKDGYLTSPTRKDGYLTSPTRKDGYLTSPTRKDGYLTSPTRKDEHLTSPTRITDRINELTQENQRLRSEMEQMQTRKRRSCGGCAEQVQRINELMQENQRLRRKRSCGRCENLTQEHAKRIKALSAAYDEQLRFGLEQKEAELKQSRERMSTLNRLREENHGLKRAPSVCQRCEDQAQEHGQTVREMETFYRSKLSEARSALEQKEEQFRSFKDRVAGNVLFSSTTENTENMNSPVNRSRLTEMYQQLRVCVWPHINWTRPEHQARDLVQEVFSRAHQNMTKALNTVCAGSTSSPQVDTFRRRALENLQLLLLHSSKQEACQKAFPSLSGPELDLASECYWLGCLMALHSPPLHPHWDRASGLVFPQDIRD